VVPQPASTGGSWTEQRVTPPQFSFHEFELAIGPGVYDRIVLDGYEPEITSLFAVSPIDRTLQRGPCRIARKSRSRQLHPTIPGVPSPFG
jgi:hypothetical protein